MSVAGFHLTIHWIPSHIGISGNEKADQLAKQGAISNALGPEPFVPISNAIFKLSLNKKFQNLWTKRWQASNTCRQTKLWLPKSTNKIENSLWSITRQKIALMVQTITGHCNF